MPLPNVPCRFQFLFWIMTFIFVQLNYFEAQITSLTVNIIKYYQEGWGSGQ